MMEEEVARRRMPQNKEIGGRKLQKELTMVDFTSNQVAFNKILDLSNRFSSHFQVIFMLFDTGSKKVLLVKN